MFFRAPGSCRPSWGSPWFQCRKFFVCFSGILSHNRSKTCEMWLASGREGKVTRRRCDAFGHFFIPNDLKLIDGGLTLFSSLASLYFLGFNCRKCVMIHFL